MIKGWLRKEAHGSGEVILVKFKTMFFLFFVSHTVLVNVLQVLALKHFCDMSDGISLIPKGTLLSDVHIVIILKA